MSTSDSLLHPEEKIMAGPGFAKAKAIGFGGGILLLIAAVIYGVIMGDGMRHFLHSYVVSFTYFTSFAVGALFYILIMHLIGAKWSVVTRRIAEVLTKAFPLLFVLSAGIWLPMLVGGDNLYIWTNHSFMEHSHLVHGKAGYLNAPFFAIRICIYFAVWIGVSRYFLKTSLLQDESKDPELTAKMAKWAAPAMFAFAFSTAFFAFDLLMSIEPEWFSTMFGVYYFAGCAISIFALMVLIPAAFQRSGRLKNSITVEHYHDHGKLLFAFVFFWGYVAFSQFMLIWGANIPEETFYYHKRWFTVMGSQEMGNWAYLSLALLLCHFIFPFVILLSRHTKRHMAALSFFAIWCLLWHWVDLYWQVMPAFENHVGYGGKVFEPVAGLPADILLLGGMGLLFMGVVAQAMSKVPLIAKGDPGLAQSLRFENQ